MGFLRKSRQEPGWLAIRFRVNGLDFAHVRRDASGKPKVTRCEFHELHPDDADELQKLRREARLDAYSLTTLLEAADYQLLLVDAPSVAPAELKSAIRWRIKDLIDIHLEDAMVDVVNVPFDSSSTARAQAMYVVVAANETIRRRVSLFDGARLPLKVIDIPEMAERNVAHLFERNGRVTVLLTFDETGGLVTFTRGGELHLSRRIDITLGQLQDADEELRRAAQERAATEAQRSLDYFDRQFQYLPLGTLLLAPFEGAEALRDRLASEAGISSEILNLADGLDLSGVPGLADPRQQARFLDVIGAALREEDRVL
jgi:MSHA biogenesis protein MshI